MNKNNYKIINNQDNLISSNTPLSYENKNNPIETKISSQINLKKLPLPETNSTNENTINEKQTTDENKINETINKTTDEKVIKLTKDLRKSKNILENKKLLIDSTEHQKESTTFATLSYNDFNKDTCDKHLHPEWIEYPPDSGNYIKTFGVVWNLIHQTNCLADYLTSEKVRYMEYFYSVSFSK